MNISYRAGDYATFRAALLQYRDREVELRQWRPTSGDLALQLVEWFAYIGDVLTFYNEQAANNSYLATAFLPGSVERLVRVLGYRPRPGIGARGFIGAVFAPNATGAVTIPVTFAVQSKPTPQVFELDSAKPIVVPAIGKLPAQVPAQAFPGGLSLTTLLLEGVVTGLNRGDVVMLAAPGASDNALVTIDAVAPEEDARGRKSTRVKLAAPVTIDGDPRLYGLHRATQSMTKLLLATGPSSIVDLYLASLARGLKVGDAVALSDGRLAKVSSYSERVATSGTMSILHSVLQLADPRTGSLLHVWNVTSIELGFRRIATLVAEPATSPLPASTGLNVVLDEPTSVATFGASVLVEGADGNGVLGELTSTDPKNLAVAVDAPRPLELPLEAMFALIPVSRGKTVSNEVLGSGDAAVPGQVFTLEKAPLTYFAGPTTTLRVWVNGVQWKEVSSFYEQPANAQVFVTRETVEQKTEVVFGDGVNGARLPSGRDNVVATYRYGSGKASPPAGSLTTILEPVPGLRSVRNPVAVGGGDDPQPPEKIRQNGPRSVLTFGRAISASDYEAIAAEAPAVTRARAYYTWHAERQRALVKVYVGDDDAACASARSALESARDRNLPLQVLLAKEKRIGLGFTLVVDARFQPDAVGASVRDVLLDLENGLFAPRRMRIGERLYESRIIAECLAVPGAVALRQIRFGAAALNGNFFWHRFPPFLALPVSRAAVDPGEGGFFTLSGSNLSITTEVADE